MLLIYQFWSTGLLRVCKFEVVAVLMRRRSTSLEIGDVAVSGATRVRSVKWRGYAPHSRSCRDAAQQVLASRWTRQVRATGWLQTVRGKAGCKQSRWTRQVRAGCELGAGQPFVFPAGRLGWQRQRLRRLTLEASSGREAGQRTCGAKA